MFQGGATTTVTTIDKTGMVRASTGPNGTMNALPDTYYWRYGPVPSAVQLNGVQTTLTYDGAMRLSTATSPEGTSTFGWDTMERPTSKRGPDGSEVKITYSYTPGQAMTKEVSRNQWTETYLDGLGRPVRVQTGYGGVDLPRPGQQPPVQTPRVVETLVDTRYAACACNPFGKPYQVSRPRTSAAQPLVWTVTTYDALGRPVNTVHAPVSGTGGNSGTTTYGYAVVAGPRMQTTVTDPAGRWKRSATDAFGDLREVFEPNPAGSPAETGTNYTYNAIGKLVLVQMARTEAYQGGVKTPILQQRSFNYNSDGTLQSTVFPETGTTRYVYGNGKVAKKFDKDNRATKWEYDATSQRLVYVKRLAAPPAGTPDWQDGVEDTTLRTTYSYDGAGQVSTVESGLGATFFGGTTKDVFTYTPYGQLGSKQLVTGWGTLTASWTYDSVGRVRTVTHPSGVQRRYAYDNSGRNNVVGENVTQDPDLQSQYDPVSNEWVGWRNALATAVYDPFGRMTTMGVSVANPGGWTGPNGTWVQGWTFNEGGQMISYGLGKGGVYNSEGYDYGAVPAAGKLVASNRYEHDMNWNVTGQVVTSYVYDSVGRLSSALAGSGSGTLWTQADVYDGFGNLVKKTGTGQAAGAAMDATGTFNSANNGAPTGPHPYAVFDQEQRLVSYAPGGVTETYGYDSSNRRVVRKRTGSGYEAEVTFWGGGRRMGVYRFVWDTNHNVCCLVTGTDYATVGGRTVAPSDRLGSDISGGRRMLPYGEELTTSLNDTDKFATYRRDMTGLDYADQRYYYPGGGRFMTADLSGLNEALDDPASLNQYAYVQGDPVNFNDPEGLERCGSRETKGLGRIGSFESFVNAQNDWGILGTTIFAESRIAVDQNSLDEKSAIAAVIMNRWQIVNGYYWISDGPATRNSNLIPVLPDWGRPDGTIAGIVHNPNQFATWQANGSLSSGSQTRLNQALNRDADSVECLSLFAAMTVALNYWEERNDHALYTNKSGMIFTSFNSFANPHPSHTWETRIGSFGSPNVFYGIPSANASKLLLAVEPPSRYRPRPGDRRR